MSDTEAPAAVAPVVQKAKKVTKKTKAKPKPKDHPSFKDMIVEALENLNQPRVGVSNIAIRKYIVENFAPKNHGTFLKKNLRKMVENGELEHPKKWPGKYVFPDKHRKSDEEKETTRKPRAKVVPKKTTTKKPAAKKTPKKVAAKPAGAKKGRGRPALKKVVAKPKAAAKPATGGAKKGRGRPKKN